MSSGGTLETILTALRELGGYFVWRADDGEEYVVTSRRDFDARYQVAQEEQLELLGHAVRVESFGGPKTADDMLEKINRDLALYQLQQAEEGETEELSEEDMTGQLPLAPIEGKPFEEVHGKRVRFEPLRGDLPPDLQE